MRDKIAAALRGLEANDISPEVVADRIMGLIRLCPTTETVDRYDGMTTTATDRVNRYALVPLPEEDE